MNAARDVMLAWNGARSYLARICRGDVCVSCCVAAARVIDVRLGETARHDDAAAAAWVDDLAHESLGVQRLPHTPPQLDIPVRVATRA
jgi:hypothetical protein